MIRAGLCAVLPQSAQGDVSLTVYCNDLALVQQVRMPRYRVVRLAQ